MAWHAVHDIVWTAGGCEEGMLGKVAKQQRAALKTSCRGSSLRVHRAAMPAPARHQPGRAYSADLLSCRSVTLELLSQCSLGFDEVDIVCNAGVHS